MFVEFFYLLNLGFVLAAMMVYIFSISFTMTLGFILNFNLVIHRTASATKVFVEIPSIEDTSSSVVIFRCSVTISNRL